MPAWEHLQKRYNNVRVLVNEHVKSLLEDDHSKPSEFARVIRRIIDRSNEAIESLRSLGVLVDSWDALLVHVVTRKLPTNTHQLWEEKLGNTTEIPKFENLVEFLEGRFRTLEMIDTESNSSVNREKSEPRQKFVQRNAGNVEATCVMCRSTTHRLPECLQYSNLSQEKRLEMVRAKLLCINCLRAGHRVLDCRVRTRCSKCQKGHHTTLHKADAQVKAFTTQANRDVSIEGAAESQKFKSEYPVGIESTSKNSIVTHHANWVSPSSRVLLATAMVKVRAPSGLEYRLRALLDQGSQATFITEAATQLLKLKKKGISASIKGLGNKTSCTSRNMVVVEILDIRSQPLIEVEAFVLKRLTEVAPVTAKHTESWSHLEGLELADPTYLDHGKIDLLLGAEVYAHIIQDGLRRGRPGTPIAQKTALGWVLSGSVGAGIEKVRNVNTFTTTVSKEHEAIDDVVRKFWEIEEVIEIGNSKEDECEAFYKQTVQRDTEGRYVVSLPFKENTGKMFGRSRPKAIARLLQMENKFKLNAELKREYSKCIGEYESLGHMSLCDTAEGSMITEENRTQYKCNYLPHHAVFKESSSTKTRIVFDASSKNSDGISLNDKLLTGPVIQDLLVNIILRWRRYKIVFTADLHKMYRQINVPKEDSQCQRIVWRDQHSGLIKDYRLTTVTFGTACAPFLAIRTLRQLAEDEKYRFPLAYTAVEKEFYVDDLLSGGHTLDDAKSKQIEIINLMKSGKFELRKWSTNKLELLENVDPAFVEMKISKEIEFDDTVKMLGIHWNPITDNFGYKLRKQDVNLNPTKRQVTSDIARVFDPIGWLAPVIIKAKILIQKLWIIKIDWDDKLPDEVNETWQQYKKELSNVELIKIPRWISTEQKETCQVHGFSDASQLAYAAVVYVRIIKGTEIFVHLVAAKTKVAPLKQVTLPRLELCGATLLSKLMGSVVTALEMENCEKYAWCDSKIVLDWVNGNPQRWKTFVSNRVMQITAGTKVKWNYVPSQDNPADCASRGVTPIQLLNHRLWWTGPEWLRKVESNWPESYICGENEIEKKVQEIKCNLITCDIDDLLSKYSSLNTLIRITALCRRFMTNAKSKKENRMCSWITTTELCSAHDCWIKYVQLRDFPNEIASLRNGKNISKKSRLISLHPFLDGDGILRVGGRLGLSDLPYSQKHPIILDHHSILTKLIIREAHKQTLHGGSQLMVSHIRRKYWVTDLRNTIRYQMHKCVICSRYRAKLYEQLMGDLPKERTKASKTFYHTGVDYCGPFDVKASLGRSPKTYKAYVAVFICMVTKAVHMEVVTGLTTDAFIAAFRRFVGRRGFIGQIHIHSDNGTNFVGASKQLTKDIEATWKDETLFKYFGDHKIHWHFIPPNFGGLWEAAVRSAKYHMKRIMSNAKLTYEEFNTTLIQIEACLNSRPLVPINNEVNELEVLTPGHFLTGDSLLGFPEPSLLDLPENRLHRWQYVQKLMQSFWKQWSTTYLHTLNQRKKWQQGKSNVENNTIVLIKEDNLPPSRWLLGRIVDTHKGHDGLVRVVTIKTKDATIKRPISKICVLPVSDDEQLK